MRVALLSDIHGNLTALEAVLADAEAYGGADQYWILGDLVALGPDPVEVLERLQELPGLRCLGGNTDRYVVTGDRPSPTINEAAADPSKLPALVEVAGTFAWTQGVLSRTPWLSWLSALPADIHETLPDGTPFLGVHASPGMDEGEGLGPALESSDRPLIILRGVDTGLVCAGHTHIPWDYVQDELHLVNVGAVSLSLRPDKKASYALLEATFEGYRIEHRAVDYDRAAVSARLRAMNHPGRAYLLAHLA